MKIIKLIKRNRLVRFLWELQHYIRIFPCFLGVKLHGNEISLRNFKKAFFVNRSWRQEYSEIYRNSEIIENCILYSATGESEVAQSAVSVLRAFAEREDFGKYTHILALRDRKEQLELWRTYGKKYKNVFFIYSKSLLYGEYLAKAKYIITCGVLNTVFTKREGQKILFIGTGAPKDIRPQSIIQPRNIIRTYLLADCAVANAKYFAAVYSQFDLQNFALCDYTDNTSKRFSKRNILSAFMDSTASEPKNRKPKLLICVGSMLKNSLSETAFASLKNPEFKDYDVTLFFANGKTNANGYKVDDIPPYVRSVVATKDPFLSDAQAAVFRDICAVGDKKFSVDDCKFYFTREYVRNFGSVKFDKVIDYTGYFDKLYYIFKYGVNYTVDYTKIPVTYRNGEPKITTIVPVYNVEKYLHKCLSTLAEQTIDEIEILVVNDGTPDRSQSVINMYSLWYPDRIKPLIKENGGLSDTRNYGMRFARGKYITFADSDDYLDIDAMQKFYDTAESQDADVVISDFIKVKPKSRSEIRRTGKKFSYKRQWVTSHAQHGKSVTENPEILRYASSYAWNKCYRRDLLTDGNFQFPVNQWFEDSAVVYNILMAAKKVAALKEPTYYYRVGREGAITSTVDMRIFHIFNSCDSIVNYAKENGFFEQLKLEIEYLCIMHLHARLIALKNTYKLGIILKFNKQCYEYLNKNFPNWTENKYYSVIKQDRILKNALFGINKYRDTYEGMRKFFILNSIRLVLFRNKLARGVWSLLIALKKKTTNSTVQAKIEPGSQDNEVKEVQRYALRIMDVIHRFCEENNITYFLAEGSLLGAVRHGGFIPWDDDMDICMLRPDYDKFIKLWGKREIEHCLMLNNTVYKKYYIPFTKIVLNEETGFFNNQHYFPKKFQGPFVDIFPIDKCAEKITQEDIFLLGDLRRYRDYLLYKIGYIKNTEKRRCLRLKATFLSYRKLHSVINNIARTYSDNTDGYVANFFSSYKITNEHFKAEWFSGAVLAPFDGREYYVPIGANEILTVIYGDYKTPPPINKQVCKHGYTVNQKIRLKVLSRAKKYS